MVRLPIEDSLPDIRGCLGEGAMLVLQAPPGAGKTTIVPLALIDEPWLSGRRIVMLEPRRLAARAAAARMAELLGEHIGDCVGYRIRFNSKVGPKTRNRSGDRGCFDSDDAGRSWFGWGRTGDFR